MLKRVLRISVLAFAAAVPARAAIPATERQVLLNLYASTSGAGWTHRTGWGGAAGTECSWYGVGCDGAGAHVTELNLDSNNLSGTLPSIGGLPDLEYFILSNNRLTGSIPPVSTLTHLRILELYANSLTGSIPSLAGLSSLTSLELNSNRLTGSIPSLAALTSLQVFDLDTNDLTGTVPSLSAMTQVQYIALDTNRLSGPIPPLSALTQLSDCELYDNDFSGAVPSLTNLSRLRILLLSNNALTGAFPDPTGTVLETLDADYNALSGPLPSSVGNAKTLRRLLVAGNALVGALPASLANLTSLEAGGSDFRYDGFWSTSATLTSFLDSKQEGGDWPSTQTVAPAGVSASAAANDAIQVRWTPIAYGADPGGYDVWYSTASGGPWSYFDSTPDKSGQELTVTGLPPSATYFFEVRTTTDPNANNANVVTSPPSVPVSAATTSCGSCSLVPAALSVTGSAAPTNVLAAGETAAVSPAWKNVGTASIAGVNGAITGFTGPGADTVTYTVSDGSASYGTLSPGATASCGASCYQISIGASARPAFHWDALLTESLNGSEEQIWRVHVGASFADVAPGTTFYPMVENLLHNRVTEGCAWTSGNARLYCAGDATRRGQMAAFIARAETGDDANVPVSGTVSGLGTYSCGGTNPSSLFADVAPGDVFCRHIHFLAARGVTFGCADLATSFGPDPGYCPGGTTTRATMAVFIARDLAGGEAEVLSRAPASASGRAYDCTDGKPNAFSDVDDADPICRYVYFIWWRNVVDGYTDGTYRPANAVRRDEMAKYLVNAYGLQLYGPR